MDSPQPNATPSAAAAESPQAVVLQARKDEGAAAPTGSKEEAKNDQPIRLARRTFRPTHKATFIAAAVIIGLIAINAGVVAFIIQRQAKTNTKNQLSGVSVSKSLLDQLGVNRAGGNSSQQALVVSPNAIFDGTLSVSKDVKLGTTLSAGNTSLSQLSAGNTSLTQLNVNGATSLSDTTIRTNLTTAGNTHLQGTVAIDKLLTVNSGANVSGDLTIGGALTTNNFSARSLTSISTLTIGGHVITNGTVPSFSQGSAPGPSGTVSISGNDSAGTIVMNTGQSPAAGLIINVTFRTPYTNTPHIVISASGPDQSSNPSVPLGFYVNRSATGFSLVTFNTPAVATGYVFDYIIEQ